jgi:hypothetical protein
MDPIVHIFDFTAYTDITEQKQIVWATGATRFGALSP